MKLLKRLYGGRTGTDAAQLPAVYPLALTTSSGDAADLAGYSGTVLLIVNTASKCGFTGQYDALEKLHERFGPQGFAVLGFPSNDFAGQEPGSDSQIGEFCKLRFGVTFPLFAKGGVKGPNKQPIFRKLTEEGPNDLRGEVMWNFEKFLVDRSGKLIGRWRSYVSPSSKSITRAIAAALKSPAPG